MKWICTVCGYQHEGATPPETCPVCGAGADAFKPADSPDEGSKSFSGHILIIGAGIAGVSAAESARKTAPDCAITLIGREPERPYHRMNLTRYLAGEVAESELELHPQKWFDERSIHLITDATVNEIDAAQHQVTLENGNTLQYDRLILCTGAHPFMPPIDGSDKQGIMTIRTIGDVNFLKNADLKGVRVAAIGGGLLGLETAGALAKMGTVVTIIENAEWILKRQIEKAAAAKLRSELENRGMSVLEDAQATAFEGGEHLEALRMEDGMRIPADLAVITAGIRPNLELAQQAEIKIEKGVVVDSHMRTSNQDIYAAGDMAEFEGRMFGLWVPSLRMGICAGTCAAGGNSPIPELKTRTALKVLGINIHEL